jgi:hypothetical protein
MSLHKYLSPLLPVYKTARASSVSDPHSLYADPDLYPALRMNMDPDLEQGEMLPNIFKRHLKLN